MKLIAEAISLRNYLKMDPDEPTVKELIEICNQFIHGELSEQKMSQMCDSLADSPKKRLLFWLTSQPFEGMV